MSVTAFGLIGILKFLNEAELAYLSSYCISFGPYQFTFGAMANLLSGFR
jgi:hypothetical protein